MLNLEVFSVVLVDFSKSMEQIEYLTHHFQSKALQVLLLDLLLQDILQLLKYNSVIIFSLLSIKLSIRLLSIDLDQEDNLIVQVLHLELHGVLLVMVLFIIHNLLKLILLILLDLKQLFLEIQFKQRAYYWHLLEIQTL